MSVDRTEHETKFIKEYCRKLMVKVCAQVASDGEYSPIAEPYFSTMLSQGFLTKKKPHLPTAKGWKVATAFLKR